MKAPLPLFTASFISLVLCARAEVPTFPAFHTAVSTAAEQAHSTLWSGHVDKYGVILDFIGELPTPEDCALGKPNAIGWRTPIANGPMFTGLYLAAATERARRSGAAADKAEAKRLAEGLIKCASVSDVPGFIARGIGSDGTCHYPTGSDDQTHPWFYGLYSYLKSGIPSPDEKKLIATKMEEVANVLESTGWKCPCDGAYKGQFRSGFSGHLFRDVSRYLFLLRVTYEVTNDPVWLERYRKALAERPLKGDKTRAEICALGFIPDGEAIKNITGHALWIYVGTQGSLAVLRDLETDESIRKQYQAGLEVNAKEVRSVIKLHGRFDNNDTQSFGHAKWREAYAAWWFPQPKQSDAEKLTGITDKEAKLGGRKSLEAEYMKNPLAGAAILALAKDSADVESIEQTIRHYDYSKLNMSEFFFAECAYYSLPK